MKKLILTIFCVALVGCHGNRDSYRTQPVDQDPLKFSCQRVGGKYFSLTRCENSEAICYRISSGGLQCQWKNETRGER